MTFYVIDPKGYRLPYTPDDFRVMRRGYQAKPTEDFTDRPALKWPDDPRAPLPSKEEKEEAPPADPFAYLPPRSLAIPLLAKQVMQQKVITIPPAMPLIDAWKTLAEHRFRHLPIVDSGTLCGIISDRRLAREIINRVRKEGKSTSIPVEEVMVTPVLTASPSTEVGEIARLLIKERVGCMPIVDEESELKGIITRSDLLRLIANKNK